MFSETSIKILACVGIGLAATEYLLHNYAPPYVSERIRSYHITKDDIFIWPLSNLTGEFCSDHYSAKSEYQNVIKEDSYGKYKLISFPTMVVGFFWPTIICKVGANIKVHEE